MFNVKTVDADQLPSASIISQTDQHLATLATQKQKVQNDLDNFIQDRDAFQQEQQTLAARRVALEEEARRQAASLEQAESDAKLAATVPIALASATAKVTQERKSAQTSAMARDQELRQIGMRLDAIAGQMETLLPRIDGEQSKFDDLLRQETLVRASREKSVADLGMEIFKLRSSRLDVLNAHLGDASKRLVDLHVGVRSELEAAHESLAPYGDLRAEFSQKYGTPDDATVRILDSFEAFLNVLDADGVFSVPQIGRYTVARELALSDRDLEIILTNPAARARILQAKRGTVQQLKLLHLGHR